MNHNKKYIFIILVIMAIYALVEYTKEKPIDWAPTYINTQKKPYATYILYDYLQDIFKGKKITTQREPVYNTAEKIDIEKGGVNYLFIGNSFAPDTLDMMSLNNLVNDGCHVFIAAEYFEEQTNEQSLQQILGFKFGYDNDYKDSVKINFVSPNFKKRKPYKFPYYDANKYFDLNSDSRAEVLATDSAGNPVYIRCQFGEGYYYVTTIPLAFTNYYLMEKEYSDYAVKCLSYMPLKDVYWDEYGKQGRAGEASMFRVMFDNPPLTWAYYITIFSLLAYIIFERKRKQRIIPIIKPPVNSSVEFARSISQLYMRNMDHHNIALKKVDYFLDNIRDKYRVNTNTFTNEITDELANRSGMSKQKVEELFKMINFVKYSETIDVNHLMNLNNMIKEFEKTANQK